MKRLQAAIALLTFVCATQAALVDAKTVRYPHEAACPVVADRPDRDTSLHEQIAHTSNGDIAYYRFGRGTPIVLQTGFRANMFQPADYGSMAISATVTEGQSVLLRD